MAKTGGHAYHVGRTLEWFRDCGFLCAKTEKRALIIRPGMPRGMCMIGPSQDLFGVADVVAIPPATYPGRRGAWFVQVCARCGLGGHRRKALEAIVNDFRVLPFLEAAGNRFLIVNYAKESALKKDGTPAARDVWQRRVEEYLGTEVLVNGVLTAGFVDWRQTDFDLAEGRLRPAQLAL